MRKSGGKETLHKEWEGEKNLKFSTLGNFPYCLSALFFCVWGEACARRENNSAWLKWQQPAMKVNINPMDMGWATRKKEMFMLFIRNYRQSDLLSPRFSTHNFSFFSSAQWSAIAAQSIHPSKNETRRREPSIKALAKQFYSIEWTFKHSKHPRLFLMICCRQSDLKFMQKVIEKYIQRWHNHGWIAVDSQKKKRELLLMLHDKAFTREGERGFAWCLTLKSNVSPCELLPYAISSDITTSHRKILSLTHIQHMIKGIS